MAKQKEAKHASPGKIITVDEHVLVQYPSLNGAKSSEEKGVCRYLVVDQVKGHGLLVYRVTSKKSPVWILNPSQETKKAYLADYAPLLVPEDLVVGHQLHGPKLTDFTISKTLIQTGRKSSVRYNTGMQKLREKKPELTKVE